MWLMGRGLPCRRNGPNAAPGWHPGSRSPLKSISTPRALARTSSRGARHGRAREAVDAATVLRAVMDRAVQAPPTGPNRAGLRVFVVALGVLSAGPTEGEALQGGSRPHSPAVARGRRATSPVRAETLFHLAFSGIAASPPCAEQRRQKQLKGIAPLAQLVGTS